MTYTKTVTTITMEPSGNVSHSQQYTWFVPCADAPSLPPVGAPDLGGVTRTTTLMGKPLATHTGECLPCSQAQLASERSPSVRVLRLPPGQVCT